MNQTEAQHSLHCICHGVSFRLCANDPSLLQAMSGVLPYSTLIVETTQESDQEFTFPLPTDDACIDRYDIQSALDGLGRDLMVYVADFAPGHVFLHAGVVGWRGRAMVFPGPSFAGKTTLIAEMIKQGATYYSDEYAVIDAEGRVHPFARDLQMRSPGRLDQHSVPPQALSGELGVSPLTVSHVIFAKYATGASWDPKPVSTGMAILEMLRHTIPVRRTPARVLSTLGNMLRDARALRSKRGDAQETARMLLQSAMTAIESRQ